MPPDLIDLKILLPSRVFASKSGVMRVVANTPNGSFGLLPHRLDCVAALAPGILTYETAADGEVSVAIDQGVLVKVGAHVTISVREAFDGADLGKLKSAVEERFVTLDERQQSERRVLAKLEAGFLHRLATYGHE